MADTSSEMTAASALAAMADDSVRDNDNSTNNKGEDFLIPQRFTKSGRKRAVPFSMKVGCFIEGAAAAEFDRFVL